MAVKVRSKYFIQVIYCNPIEGPLPLRVIFRQRSSSVKDCLPSKFVFHKRLSSIKDCLPSKVVFRQRSSSVKSCLPSKISSVKGHLPSKVVFHQSLSCAKGKLPFKVEKLGRMVQNTLISPFIQKVLKDPQTGGLFKRKKILTVIMRITVGFLPSSASTSTSQFLQPPTHPTCESLL